MLQPLSSMLDPYRSIPVSSYQVRNAWVNKKSSPYQQRLGKGPFEANARRYHSMALEAMQASGLNLDNMSYNEASLERDFKLYKLAPGQALSIPTPSGVIHFLIYIGNGMVVEVLGSGNNNEPLLTVQSLRSSLESAKLLGIESFEMYEVLDSTGRKLTDTFDRSVMLKRMKRVLDFWDVRKAQTASQYDILSNNCETVVYKILSGKASQYGPLNNVRYVLNNGLIKIGDWAPTGAVILAARALHMMGGRQKRMCRQTLTADDGSPCVDLPHHMKKEGLQYWVARARGEDPEALYCTPGNRKNVRDSSPRKVTSVKLQNWSARSLGNDKLGYSAGYDFEPCSSDASVEEDKSWTQCSPMDKAPPEMRSSVRCTGDAHSPRHSIMNLMMPHKP